MFKKVYYRLSFKNRIWITFAVLIAVAVTLTGWASYTIAGRVVESNAIKLSQDTLNQSAQVLDERLRRVTLATRSLILSYPFQQTMNQIHHNQTDSYFLMLAALQSPFMQMKTSDPSIYTVMISSPIGDFYPHTFVRNTAYDFYESDIYERMLEQRRATWIEGHEDQFFTASKPVISLVMEAIADVPVDDTYVIVNVRERTLQDAITRNTSEMQANFILMSREGQAVIQPRHPEADLFLHNEEFLAYFQDQDAIRTEGDFEFVVDGEHYLVNYATSQIVQDWILVNIQPKSELLAEVNWIKWATFVISIVCVVLVLLVSNILARLLFQPLNRLQKLMQEAGGNNLDVRFESPYRDEVSLVGRQFNLMLYRMKGLLYNVKRIEKEKRMSEIRVLQAQINPHFLYNTLNTLYWKSQLGQKDDVSAMILSLSKMIKLGLNHGQEMTTVAKEVEHIKQYMDLQMQCYEGLFQYDIQIASPSLHQYPLLKLMLQPIVENSILHGFEDLDREGMIHIRIERDEDHLILQVQDNGIGMDVAAVYEQMKQESIAEKGFALRNIYHRLQLYYGHDASIELRSESDSFTIVSIRLPLQEVEQDEINQNGDH